MDCRGKKLNQLIDGCQSSLRNLETKIAYVNDGVKGLSDGCFKRL